MLEGQIGAPQSHPNRDEASAKSAWQAAQAQMHERVMLHDHAHKELMLEPVITPV